MNLTCGWALTASVPLLLLYVCALCVSVCCLGLLLCYSVCIDSRGPCKCICCLCLELFAGCACVLPPCTYHLDGQGLIYVCAVPLYLLVCVCDFVLPV